MEITNYDQHRLYNYIVEWVFYAFPNIFGCHDGTMSQAAQVWSIFHCSDRSCSYDSPFPSSHLHSCRLVPCGKPVDPAIKQLAVGSSGPIYLSIHPSVRPSIHPYIYMYVCMYVRMYVCMYVCMYVYAYIYIYMYVYIYIYVYIYMYIYICIYIYTYVCIYIYMYIYIHTYIYIYIYIHMCVWLWGGFRPADARGDCHNFSLRLIQFKYRPRISREKKMNGPSVSASSCIENMQVYEFSPHAPHQSQE